MADSHETILSLGLNSNLNDASNSHKKKDFQPCLKHAAEILARSSSIDTSEKPLCKNCSQSMLSYIFLIQDALDNLARKMYCGENSNSCLQCLRQESSGKVNTLHGSSSTVEMRDEEEKPTSTEQAFQTSSISTNQQKADIPDVPPDVSGNCAPVLIRKTSVRRNSRRLSREQKEIEIKNSKIRDNENNVDRQGCGMEFLYNVSPKYATDGHHPAYEEKVFSKNMITVVNQDDTSPKIDQIPCFHEEKLTNCNFDYVSKKIYSNSENSVLCNNQEGPHETSKTQLEDYDQFPFDNSLLKSNSNNSELIDSMENNFNIKGPLPQPSLYANPNGRSCTVLQNDIESLEKPRDGNNIHVADDYEQISTRPSPEAFVTICRNNSDVLGCVVLGSSLLLSRSSKTFCVLVFDEVDDQFRALLSSVFHIVEYAASMDVFTTEPIHLNNLNLKKLIIWRLVRFSKCVYLNPNTLVLSNCDELFHRDELSAVSDVGWPDCFNTGVFVFVPSVHTFSQLMDFAQNQEYENDGDEIFMNAFFSFWSRDISKKLSFIYNLTGNSSYTYTSAFQKFGHAAKIVQFTGSLKPWQVKFYSETGQIHEMLDVHPTYIRFIYEWISIFRVAVLRLLPQVVNASVLSQNILTAEDVLGFLQQSSRRETLNHPSISPENSDDIKQYKTNIIPKECIHKGTYADCSNLRRTSSEVFSPGESCIQKLSTLKSTIPLSYTSSGIYDLEQNDTCSYETVLLPTTSSDVTEEILRNKHNVVLPGAIVGDYQGMRAWEQGQMDYSGCDNSENIIKRLQFLMDQPQY